MIMSVVEHMSYDQLQRMQSSARIFQERYQQAVDPWDRQIKGPMLGQSVDDYRKETLVQMKKLLPPDHKLRIPVRDLRSDALNVIEPQICKAVHAQAYDPSTVPRGEYRRVVEINQGGTKIVKWIGQESFVKEFTRPGRQVTSFRTDQGYVSASGRPLR
jgi:hypothetical protein